MDGIPEGLVGNDLVMALNKMEDEHLRLQRQFRMIQTDRMNRTVGIHPQFRRQDRLLVRLKKEYVNLVKDLKIAMSGAHKKRSKKIKRDLKQSLLNIMQSINESEGGENLMEELNGLLRCNHKNLLELQAAVQASQGELEERRIQSEHRLVSTENKLETSMRRFNVIQYQNHKLRDEIEHMLRDRVQFTQVWIKMLTALGKGKKYLTDLFESSTVAYDERDEWCTKLQCVQEKGMMDQMLQVQEMRELQNVLDNETRLYNFLSRKGMMRINKQEEERSQVAKLKAEEDIKKILIEHENILEEIRNYMQMYSVDDIIANFENVECHNFSIYELLTSLCAEHDALSRDVAKIRRELVDRREWNDMMDAKRERGLDKLRQEVEDQQKETNEIREKYEAQVKLIDYTVDEIADIAKMLDCSLEPFQNLLGDKDISVWRLDITMNLITEKIKEYVQTVCYYERHFMKKGTKVRVHGAGSSSLKKYTIRVLPPLPWKHTPLTRFVPADPCPTCVEARWLSRVSEELELPFDQEMTLKALNGLKDDPAYEQSDRLHNLTDCRLPHSRLILARRYA